MGGPDMAPQTPQRSEAPRQSRGAPRHARAARYGPPYPPTLGSAPALLERRERGRAPDLVDDALDERTVRFARLARGQPLGIGHEGLPHALAVREVVVRADVDHLVRLADHRLPEADDRDAVLLEELHGDVGEAALQVRHAAWHDVIRAVFVDHRASLAAALPRGGRGATRWWQSPASGATAQAARRARRHEVRRRAESCRGRRSGGRSVRS